ncbi:uncharacterized protein [Leptinotarsa decemlineata]|uniref:uncharacterized protein n=1 Tax=Leptinotarsa decemlineata TaxID=7539 RepID=UPI003D30ADA1
MCLVSKMKLLILVSILSVASCRLASRYPRVQELLKNSTEPEQLQKETETLIHTTAKLMMRLSETGRIQLNDYAENINSKLDSFYQETSNRTSALVQYLIDEINDLAIRAQELKICTSVVSHISNLDDIFDQQYRVLFNTSFYKSNTTMENKYRALMGNIATVQRMNASLFDCQLDVDCIVNIAELVEEQNVALMDGLDDIDNSAPTVHDQILSETNLTATKTVYVHEEYICNVALIIENCIRSRIDNPVLTTTLAPLPTTKVTNSTSTSTPELTTITASSEATPVTSDTPPTTINPQLYCKGNSDFF